MSNSNDLLHAKILGLGKSRTEAAKKANVSFLRKSVYLALFVAVIGTVYGAGSELKKASDARKAAEIEAERKQFAGLFSKAEKMVADLEARSESRNQTMIFGGAMIFEQKYGFAPSQDNIQTVIEIAAKCPAPKDLPNGESIAEQIAEARDADKQVSKETGQTPKLNAVYNSLKDKFEVLRVWDAGVDHAVTTKGYGRMQLREDFKPFCDSSWVKKIAGGDVEPVAAKPVAAAPVVEPEPEPVSSMPPPPPLPAFAQPKPQVQPEAPSFNMPPPPPVPASAQIKPAPAPKPKPAPAPSSGRVQVDDW